MYDYVIKNASVVDGTGNKRYKANVALFASSIAFIGSEDISRAKNIIDIDGKILSPGFIDMHTHTDLEILRDRNAGYRIRQGITTDVCGNCGIGTFPYSGGDELKTFVSDVLGEYPDWVWSDYRGWKEYLSSSGIGINQAYLVSHTALRVNVLASDSGRVANEKEIDKMCALLDRELSSGAYGFSTGLYYAPCVYADKKELISLLNVVKKHNALFAVHHRCEGNDIIESVKEVLVLARATGVRLEISHLKAIGDKNQDKVDQVIKLIEEARVEGVDVKFDQYPYTYGSTSLFSLLPPSLLAYSKYEQRLALSLENEREDIKREMENPDGWDSIYQMVGPDKIRAAYLENNKKYNGMSLTRIGQLRGESPLDALFDVLSEETGLAVMEDETTNRENLEKIMCHNLMCFGSDSLYSSPHPHPRSYHATVEFLSKYVLDKKLMSLEEGIRKISGEAAMRLNLKRGLIKEGYPADLVVFDPEKLSPGPEDQNSGIEYVFVNGVPAMERGVLTGKRGGKIL